MRVRGFNFHNQSVEYSILINIGFIGAFNKSVLDWLGGIGSYIQDSGFILDKDGNKQFLKRFTFYENEHCQDVGLKLLKFREYILKKNPKNTAIILKNESEVLE